MVKQHKKFHFHGIYISYTIEYVNRSYHSCASQTALLFSFLEHEIHPCGGLVSLVHTMIFKTFDILNPLLLLDCPLSPVFGPCPDLEKSHPYCRSCEQTSFLIYCKTISFPGTMELTDDTLQHGMSHMHTFIRCPNISRTYKSQPKPIITRRRICKAGKYIYSFGFSAKETLPRGRNGGHKILST